MGKVFIIAEAGVNHNGKLELAHELVDAAVNTGADAVKFQMFKAEECISRYAGKAVYQEKATNPYETQLEMIKQLELNYDDFVDLNKYCDKRGLGFIVSPFDVDSIELLEKLGIETFKIPSGEITNLPYLRKLSLLNKNIIMSTGMADLHEARMALDVLLSNGTCKDNVTVLHCNTAYPTPIEDVNLKAMITIRNELGVKVGYSDHTLGVEVAIAAVALGATVIEKHITLDKNMEGPDHRASLEPDELKNMICAIRNIEKALGDGIKIPSPSEKNNKLVARKSIVAAKAIKKGAVLTEKNVSVKRPGNGISPMQWDSVVGKLAKRNFCKDELIKWNDLIVCD